MQFKTKDIEITTTSPFANDMLHRQQEIENLSMLVNRLDGSLVLSIDSSWGTGKTTFIKLWKAYLESQNVSSIYLNAWESDYAEDPLVPLVASLDEWVKAQQSHGIKNEAWQKVKSILPTVAKSTAVAAVKVASFHLETVSC